MRSRRQGAHGRAKLTDDVQLRIAAGAQAKREGRLDVAAEHYAAALSLARSQGHPLLIAHVARHLGDLHRQNGLESKAERLLEEAIAIYRSSLDTKVLDIANALRPLALLRTSLGNKDSAQELWQEARNLYSVVGVAEGVAECDRYLTAPDGHRGFMAAQTRSLVAFAHVADVERSIAFYAHLGFKVANTVVPQGQSAPVWAWLESGNANLMVGLASAPIEASRQAVLFYLYFDDIKQTRAALVALGYSPGEIRYPFYMPGGECRLEDADGYVLMLAQV